LDSKDRKSNEVKSSPEKKSKTVEAAKGSGNKADGEDDVIEIPNDSLALSTKEATEMEILLDQRKAQKKEEMKERNPEFFKKV